MEGCHLLWSFAASVRMQVINVCECVGVLERTSPYPVVSLEESLQLLGRQVGVVPLQVGQVGRQQVNRLGNKDCYH